MTVKDETIPTDLLSNRDMMFMFNTNLQQIYRWRWNLDLPTHHIPSGSIKKRPVRYSFAEILAWAAKNGFDIIREPKFNDIGTVLWVGKLSGQFDIFFEQS